MVYNACISSALLFFSLPVATDYFTFKYPLKYLFINVLKLHSISSTESTRTLEKCNKL